MRAMSTALALLLIAHGIAHLVGFVVPWHIVPAPDLAARTTVFGGTLDLGEGGTKIFGILWLVLAAGFIAAGVAVISGWWDSVWIVRLTAMSLILCIAGWPDTRIGLAVNVAILVALFGFDSLGA
jgi:hypothetical protein